jgi:hypothetical protein
MDEYELKDIKSVLNGALCEFKSDMLLHDMVKEEISNWKYITEQVKIYKCENKELPNSVCEHIFNFYEYLAYLILNFKIDEDDAKKTFKPNILGIYKDFKTEFKGPRTNVKKLVKQWSD